MSSGNPLLINANTKIRDLLKVNEDLVIDALVDLNKNFSKLHNPLLKKLFAGRVTISDACRVGGVSVDSFLQCMKNIGFTTDSDNRAEVKAGSTAASTAIQKDNVLELDVRPILAGGRDPLKEILQHVGKLHEGQALKIINTFEPIPLYHLMDEKGFRYQTERASENVYITWFQKKKNASMSISTEPVEEADNDFDSLLRHVNDENVVRIDVRSLEMPKPMLLIMQTVDELSDGQVLFVNHKKVPAYLLPELKAKGFEYSIKQIDEGNVHVLIYKP